MYKHELINFFDEHVNWQTLCGLVIKLADPFAIE